MWEIWDGDLYIDSTTSVDVASEYDEAGYTVRFVSSK